MYLFWEIRFYCISEMFLFYYMKYHNIYHPCMKYQWTILHVIRWECFLCFSFLSVLVYQFLETSIDILYVILLHFGIML